MIPMTTARAVAPNLGGRANTRSRAAVANHSPGVWARSPGSQPGDSSPGFFISTRTFSMAINCRRRSAGGSFMNSRAAALQAATRFASFHSAMPVTPGGSLRLRGRAIGIA